MHSEPGHTDDRDAGSTQASPATSRDVAAGRRDVAAGTRDDVGDTRDQAGEDRDAAADQRDCDSDAQDRAERRKSGIPGDADDRLHSSPELDTLDRSAVARRAAANDRSWAAQDRRSGASDRTSAELDREIASTDRDVSQQDRTDASTDHLTGVYDRRSGFDTLGRELDRARRTGQPLVLAFFDVDGLKATNDAHGHAAGDQVLVEVATALRDHLRSYDVVMRYGGDEFVCALPGITLVEAKARFASMNDVLALLPRQTSVSVGIAELQPGDTVDNLTARADADLYATRRRHRSSHQP